MAAVAALPQSGSPAADPDSRPQAAASLAASAASLRTMLARLATQLPPGVVKSVEAELASEGEASSSRLLQACRDLQDASAGQLAPEIRPLFAQLRDHALLLDGGDDTMLPVAASAGGAPTNLLVDLPIVPLPTLSDHPFERHYHLVRDEAGARITSHGTGRMVLGMRIGESERGVSVHVSLEGEGRANLHGRRGRVDMQGLLHSSLAATTLVQFDDDAGLRYTPPKASVDNRIDLVNVDFQAHSRLVHRAGSRIAFHALERRVPELTRRSEHEIGRQVVREAERLLEDAATRIDATTAPLGERLSRDAGVSFGLGGTVVDERARVAILAEFDAARPAAAPRAWPPLARDPAPGILEVHLHESLPTRLADLAGGALLLETDFRELCLEPLGMVPEFDEDVQFGGEPARVRLAVVRPITVSFNEGSFSIDVRLDSFQSGDGEPAGPARIVATYAIDTDGDSLTLRREGPPRGESPAGNAALEALAKRFFPARAVSTDIALLEELLKSVSMTRGRLSVHREWLGLQIAYEPEALAARLGALMP